MSLTDPLPSLPPVPGPLAPEEPLLTVGGLTGLGSAVLAVLVAFAVPLTHAQDVAILGLLAVLAPIIVAVVGRGKVWSPYSVFRAVQQAKQGMP
jgi:uncharacterized membrane protein